ncbi:uncharacterized protein LOC122882929 [Siniperca chuatsi]|uniref:uncharacterized protein LOC122882929 n=1 Tax=Siniperca chuatsi TaxID=119488 RepID=UPI001CE1F93A|nr:uncharacterized protein LOC122882929 [Siniperca chuatsi]
MLYLSQLATMPPDPSVFPSLVFPGCPLSVLVCVCVSVFWPGFPVSDLLLITGTPDSNHHQSTPLIYRAPPHCRRQIVLRTCTLALPVIAAPVCPWVSRISATTPVAIPPSPSGRICLPEPAFLQDQKRQAPVSTAQSAQPFSLHPPVLNQPSSSPPEALPVNSLIQVQSSLQDGHKPRRFSRIPPTIYTIKLFQPYLPSCSCVLHLGSEKPLVTVSHKTKNVIAHEQM